ncbi:MAG: DUF433 domain-containing protein [Anaerolineales bacterium]
MDWEHYFDFINENDIRLKGTRVGIETVLEDYLNGASAEEIAARYRTLTLEQIYATITYYYQEQSAVGAYLQRWRNYTDTSSQEQQTKPSEFVQRLNQRIEQQRQKIIAEKGSDYLVKP